MIQFITAIEKLCNTSCATENVAWCVSIKAVPAPQIAFKCIRESSDFNLYTSHPIKWPAQPSRLSCIGFGGSSVYAITCLSDLHTLTPPESGIVEARVQSSYVNILCINTLERTSSKQESGHFGVELSRRGHDEGHTPRA